MPDSSELRRVKPPSVAAWLPISATLMLSGCFLAPEHAEVSVNVSNERPDPIVIVLEAPTVGPAAWWVAAGAIGPGTPARSGSEAKVYSEACALIATIRLPTRYVVAPVYLLRPNGSIVEGGPAGDTGGQNVRPHAGCVGDSSRVW